MSVVASSRVRTPFLEQSILKSFQERILNETLELVARENLNLTLPNGYLPLHFAVLEGKEESVKKLLELGADTSQKDAQGLTALEHAVYQKKSGILKLLIQHQIKNATEAQIEEEKVKAECKANALDPLRLGDVQKLFFGVTIFLALVPALTSAGWLDAELQEILVSLNTHFWQTAVFLSQAQLGDLKSFIGSMVATAGAQRYPSLGLFMQALATCSLTHSAWQGMKKAWSQARYRPWASLGHVAVHVTNLAGTGYSLFKNVRSYFTTSRPIEPPKPDIKSPFNLALARTCTETSLDQLLSLNAKETTAVQAALGISSLEAKELKNAYRRLSTWVHPDKCSTLLKEKSHEAFRHLQTLFDALISSSQNQGMGKQQVVALQELSEEIKKASLQGQELLVHLRSLKEKDLEIHEANERECKGKGLQCFMDKEKEPAYREIQRDLEETSIKANECDRQLTKLSQEYRDLLDKKHS